MGYAIESIRNGGKQARLVDVTLAAGIDQGKATRAISGFNAALSNTALANHSSLLVAGNTADV